MDDHLAVDDLARRELGDRGHGRRELGREVLGLPVGVDPDPDDRPGVLRAQPVGLAEDARELADVPERESMATRSLGHLSWTVPARRPAATSQASAIVRVTTAAIRQACSGCSQVGRNPMEGEERGARRRDPRPIDPTATGGLEVGDRHADLGNAVAEPAGDDVVGRCNRVEALEPREPAGDGRIDDVGHRRRGTDGILIEQPPRPPSRPGPGARARTRRGAPRAPSRGRLPR